MNGVGNMDQFHDRKRKLEMFDSFAEFQCTGKATNPWNGKLLSSKYYDILEKRHGVYFIQFRTSVAPSFAALADGSFA